MKMKSVRRIGSTTLCIVLLFCSVAFAAQGEVREYTLQLKNAAELSEEKILNGELPVPEVIEISGKSYEAVAAELLSVKEPTEITKSYEALSEKKVPQTIDKDGQTLFLTGTEWSESRRNAVTASKRYTGYADKPDAPSEKEITATLPSGESVTVKGKLQSVEKAAGKLDRPFEVTATFCGDSDVGYYVLPNGRRIPNDNKIPLFSGYEKLILQSLGYSTDNYSIDSGEWVSDYYVNEEGETVRDAHFSGKQRGTDWIAYYKEIVTEDSPKLIVYDAICTYAGDTSEVKVAVTYEKTAIIPKAVVVIGSAAVIMAVFAALLLSYLKRKHSEN